MYEIGTDLIWRPGPKHTKKYGKEFKAVYYRGSNHPRRGSMIFVPSLGEYIRVPNSRIGLK